MGKVYVSFYNEFQNKNTVRFNRLKLHLQDNNIRTKIFHWLSKIEDKRYDPSYFDMRGKKDFEMLYGVYLNEEDAIIFKLKFDL